jgi:hypothetical protein
VWALSSSRACQVRTRLTELGLRRLKTLQVDVRAGSVVTSGQINFQQVYSNDMYANSSQWNVKLGDPTVVGPFETRNQVLDVGNMYPCAGVDPSLYCPTTTVGVSNCVVCTKHFAFGWFQTGSWLRPQGQAAWLIDSLPFPHVPLSYTNQSLGTRYEVCFDCYGLHAWDMLGCAALSPRRLTLK